MQEEVFNEVADEFIHLANELSEDWSTPLLSAALLYAAARYNAFLVQEQTQDPQKMEEALSYFGDQYQRMLKENFREFLQEEEAS